jgi:transcriptional regulator with GAF, ATPase, and Fis domain
VYLFKGLFKENMKHSNHKVLPTQIHQQSYKTKLRFSRFQISIFEKEEWTHHIFDDGPVQIGTLPHDNHIVLNDETVSRRHCVIIRVGDEYVLEDLESTNGTFLNEVRIKSIFLTPGVEVVVGQTRMIFDRVADEPSITPTTKTHLGRIVGGDIKMREIFSVIEKIAHTDTTVVIEGATGTGKDVVARTIHETSRRATQPFVVFDCSAVPEHLIESELFGHEKGSFTGAIMARKGLFELANGGTIFLDELGELNLELQPKLLRVLENRQIRRVGASHPTPIDVRVIAATNRTLDTEVKQGRFREDLFYRLSVVRLFLPPLRDRLSDLPLLIEHFLKHASFNRFPNSEQKKVNGVDPQALEVMSKHHWPGNVRELVNVLERACSFVEGMVIRFEDLPPMMINPTAISSLSLLDQTYANPSSKSPQIQQGNSIGNSTSWSSDRRITFPPSDSQAPEIEDDFETFKVAKEKWVTLFEKDYILTTLKRSKYNISQAARLAEIDRKYFRKLMNKYEIEVPD